MPIVPVSEPIFREPSNAALKAASMLDTENAVALLNETIGDILPNGLTFEQDRIFRSALGVEKEHVAPQPKPTHRFPLDLDFELLARLDAMVVQRRQAHRKRNASSRRKIIEEALESYLDENEA